MANTPGGPTTTWSTLALEPGTRRSWLTPQPARTSGSNKRATWRSPSAPRCHAWVSGLGRNRSRHQTAPAVTMAASRPAGSGRPATAATSRPPSPASTAAAVRRGRVRAQAAYSTWRRRWYSAWAEAPGVPSARRCRRAAAALRREGSRSGGSSSGSSGGPLRTLPAGRVPLGAGARRGLLLTLGCSATAGAVRLQTHPSVAFGDALLVVDPLDGGAGALPVGPLPCVLRDRAEGAVGVADLVDGAVLLDLGSGLPPGALSPGALRHGAEGVAQVAGTVLVDPLAGQPAGAALPRQRPHHPPVLRAEGGMLLEPAGAALLVGAQLLLALHGAVVRLGADHRVQAGVLPCPGELHVEPVHVLGTGHPDQRAPLGQPLRAVPGGRVGEVDASVVLGAGAAVQVPAGHGHLPAAGAVQADGQGSRASVQGGDDAAGAVGDPKLADGVVAADHPVPDRHLPVLHAKALAAEAAVAVQDLLAVGVQAVHLVPARGQDHHVLGRVALSLLPGVPPVVQQRQRQLLLGLRRDHPVVRAVQLDRLVHLALADQLDRLALPGVQLPPVLDQLARAQPHAQGAEAAARIDRRQLPVIPDQHDLGTVPLGMLQQAGELAASDHAGLVHHQHRPGVQQRPVTPVPTSPSVAPPSASR